MTRRAANSSDLDDPPAAHSDVTVKPRQTGTVNNFSVFDDQIVRHRSSYTANKFACAITGVLRRKYSLPHLLPT
jgi:hypothetical protein